MSWRFLMMVLIGVSVLVQAVELRAEVKLPAIISNNMVLEANKPLPIWGTADAGEKVTVSFHNEKEAAVADKDGKWRVTLNPVPAGGPEQMIVAGKNSITIDNILIGNVWVCSGQSNMEFPLSRAHNANDAIAKADYPKIRLFTVNKTTSFEPLADCRGQWVECSPKTAGDFSAVGYFFGLEIFQTTGEPVGLIHTSWGGTPAQAWTSLSGLQKDPALDHFVKEEAERAANTPAQPLVQFNKEMAVFNAQFAKWKQEVDTPYQAAFQKWKDDCKQAAATSQPAPAKPEAEAPRPLPPFNPAYAPTVLFNSMINPLIPFAIDGVIWYQGEANAPQWMEYRTLFPRMISDWRDKWGEGDFPFYYVQLTNYNARHPNPVDTAWAGLREAQLRTLALPNTGMAVIIDIGDATNIHPTDKLDVGHRLALLAEKNVFQKDVIDSGPLFKELKIEGKTARISFSDIGSGLIIGVAPNENMGLPTSQPAEKLSGFAICGANQKWVWADAAIDGDTVVVSSDKVADPVAVRYGWDDNPACNLYNREGLPASPFRTDDFPLKYK